MLVLSLARHPYSPLDQIPKRNLRGPPNAAPVALAQAPRRQRPAPPHPPRRLVGPPPPARVLPLLHTTLEANLLPCAFYCRVGWAFCESSNKMISKLKRTRGAGQYGNCYLGGSSRSHDSEVPQRGRRQNQIRNSIRAADAVTLHAFFTLLCAVSQSVSQSVISRSRPARAHPSAGCESPKPPTCANH